MISSSVLLTAATLVGSSLAASGGPSAQVTIETSHGGAGSDLTNTTITVPLNKTYTNSALNEVSYLYLTGASGVPVTSITCYPYRSTNGTGTGGLPFNSTTPSLLSTNTVQVGSIVCTSNYISETPPGGLGGSSSSSAASSSSSLPASSTSASSNLTMTTSSSSRTRSPITSTFVTTESAPGGSVQQSTVTSVFVPSGPAGASATAANPASAGASATSSASASLSSASSSANSLSLSGEFYGGLALAGFGLAFVL